MPALTLTFPAPIDLPATMDIQIPALAWQADGPGHWSRTYHLPGGQVVPVTVTATGPELRFRYDKHRGSVDTKLKMAFPSQIGGLKVGTDPIMCALQRRYRGVIVMAASGFEALVLTILSQNRSGETVRSVFPKLADVCHGITPEHVAELNASVLTETIRSAGPYKAPRMRSTAERIVADGGDSALHARLSAPGALEYLTALPGVAHKTAACVLVFAARATDTLPVDVHLHRVANRLGLASHDGRMTIRNRDALIAALLTHGPDTALGHFMFLLLGRTTCTATSPDCPSCFMAPHCRHATIETKESNRT